MRKITFLLSAFLMYLGTMNANAAIGDALPRSGWSIVASSSCDDSGSGQPQHIIDDDLETFWHSYWGGGANPTGVQTGTVPEWFVIDLGSEQTLGGVSYRPRTGLNNGNCLQYKVFVSSTPFSEQGVNTPITAAADKNVVTALEGAVKTGTFDAWTAVEERKIEFDAAATGQYVMFVIMTSSGSQPNKWGCCSNFNVYEFQSDNKPALIEAIAVAQAQANAEIVLVGTNPGQYTSAATPAIEALFDAIAAAQAVVDDEASTDAEEATAIETLNAAVAAYDEAAAAFAVNPLVAGIYKINLAIKSGEYSIYDNGSRLAWKAFDANDLTFYWNVTETAGGFTIQNAAYETYMADCAGWNDKFTLVQEPLVVEAEFLGSVQFRVKVDGGMMHAQSSGGESGNIVYWDGGANSASAWKFVPVDEIPQAAIDAWNDVKPELTAKIAEFQAALAVTPYFYTAEAFTAANNAIAAAQAVVDDTTSTDEAEQAALDALVEAIAAFQPDAQAVETYNGLTSYFESNISTWAGQLRTTTGLITSAEQLYSAYDHGTVNPAATSDNAGVAALIDNDNSTYLHTAYSGTIPAGYHNLEVTFDAPVGDFLFYIYARNTGYSNNRPKTITVYGSTDDGTNYTKIKTIDYTLSLPNNGTKLESLWGIIEGGSYTKFRFDVEATNTNTQFFTMAEFQMYAKPEGAAESAVAELLDAYLSIGKMEDIYTVAANVKFPVTLNASGIDGVGNLATFSAPIATAVPENTTAYFAALEGNYVILTALEEGKAIPANEGVILESAETSLVMAYTTAEAADATANEFENTATGAKTAAALTNAYVLTGNNGVASFCKLATGTLAANKAYIVVAAEPAEVRLMFDGEATGIEGVTVAQDANAPVYDLSGRLVKATKSGIYVSKGKKFIVK